MAIVAWRAVPVPSTPQGLFLRDYTTLFSILGIVSAVLALVGSFSIGHALQFTYAALSTRSAAYSTFHARLDSLDDYLRSQDHKDPIVDTTREFVWEMNKLRLEDFPVLDWDERLASWKEALEVERKKRPQHLWHDVVRGMGRCEEALSEIGLASVRLITSELLLHPVVKMFCYLSLLLIGLAVLLVIPQLSIHVAVATVAFFTAMTVLLLAEVVWAIHRDLEERIDFIEESPNEKSAEPVGMRRRRDVERE